jgi:hypothetical protein
MQRLTNARGIGKPPPMRIERPRTVGGVAVRREHMSVPPWVFPLGMMRSLTLHWPFMKPITGRGAMHWRCLSELKITSRRWARGVAMLLARSSAMQQAQ